MGGGGRRKGGVRRVRGCGGEGGEREEEKEEDSQSGIIERCWK